MLEYSIKQLHELALPMGRLAKAITYRILHSMTSAHMLARARYCAQTPRTYITTQDRETHPAQVVAHMSSLSLSPVYVTKAKTEQDEQSPSCMVQYDHFIITVH